MSVAGYHTSSLAARSTQCVFTRSAGVLRQALIRRDSANFRVAKVYRESQNLRDMFLDGRFRPPLIEMTPRDTTVGSRPTQPRHLRPAHAVQHVGDRTQAPGNAGRVSRRASARSSAEVKSVRIGRRRIGSLLDQVSPHRITMPPGSRKHERVSTSACGVRPRAPLPRADQRSAPTPRSSDHSA